jgi:ATP-binding cassette subfamily G (WHITE) protein 2 (SNQ2)
MTASGWTPAMNHGTGEQLMRHISRTMSARSGFSDYEEPKEDEHISKAEDWSLMPEVKRFAENDPATGRKLGITWEDLTVKGIGADAAFNENVFSQFNVPTLVKEGRHPAPLRTIIDKSSGCVKPGEMLLVLGRPGAGCTTLLKMLSNRRAGYAEIEGDVKFGSMDHKEAQQYRGQIVMNTEEELFFPTLTVGRTMDFATRLRVPDNLPQGTQTREQFRTGFKDFLLRSMGIDHTADTKVGNEYVRGVSGGERKRVSIIETLATMASVYCWDNSTRGLDASTALEYTRALRAMTDKFGLATVVTLYQAGNGIYDLFDKVLVLDEGKQIYYGPRAQARPFMEKLGFICDDAANVADFLTGVTVPTERRIKEGFEAQAPRNAETIRERYEKSSIKAKMDKDLDFPDSTNAKEWTSDFQKATHADKARGLPGKSPITVSFPTQVKACVIRQYEILWGDKATFFIKQSSTLAQALISGSLFYNAPNNSSGLFIKGGALFLSLLFNALLAMSEVTDSFSGRPILAKHKAFAFYNPAAFCIAQIACDLPILVFQISVFSVVLYFMVGLKVTAAAFFTYWFVIYLSTLVMTALFRAIGAAFPTFDAASKVSGFMISALITYIGYQIPKPEMHPWFVWIYWINPMSYVGSNSFLLRLFRY